jgi:ribosomal protein L37AE/L43A
MAGEMKQQDQDYRINHEFCKDSKSHDWQQFGGREVWRCAKCGIKVSGIRIVG